MTAPLPDEEQPIAEPIVSETRARLRFLDNVGLDYLTIDRPPILSGGELAGAWPPAWVRDLSASATCSTSRRSGSTLATTTGSSKPSATSSGWNTVVVVEHDEAIIRHADWLIDLGPKRRLPRRATVAAEPLQIEADPDSITGALSCRAAGNPHAAEAAAVGQDPIITIEG